MEDLVEQLEKLREELIDQQQELGHANAQLSVSEREKENLSEQLLQLKAQNLEYKERIEVINDWRFSVVANCYRWLNLSVMRGM